MMYAWKGEVPEEDYLVPLGKADVKRAGDEVTLISFSMLMKTVLEAAAVLEKEGYSAEVLDLRSLRPLDEEAATLLAESVFLDWYDERRFDAEDAGEISIDESVYADEAGPNTAPILPAGGPSG